MALDQNIEFVLFDCLGMRGPADVVDVMALIRRAGLQLITPAPGLTDPPVVVDDLAALVSATRRDYNMSPCAPRLVMREGWPCGLRWPDRPSDACSLRIAHLHPDTWSVAITLLTLPPQGETVEILSDSWGGLLAELGRTLYDRCRPALAWLAAITADPDEAPDLLEAADRRRLIVGWRTWYGPAYVEAFGRDWLLGLPDRAAPLPDGGVAHGLDAPLAALVRGEPAPYAAVRAYLRRAGIRPAWPEPA